MKLYVGIADTDWSRYLRERRAEEMNFWRPRATSQFKILEPNELFLFKSKYPENKIIGGALFVRLWQGANDKAKARSRRLPCDGDG